MHRILGLVFAAAVALSACGGDSKTPTAPTVPNGSAAATSPGSPESATPPNAPPSSTNSVEVRGVIDTVTGTPAAFQFKIGSRVIRGNAQTAFTAHGQTDSFASLKDGQDVEVKGTQQADFILATRINVEDDAPDADDDEDEDDNDADENNDDDDDDNNQDQSASLHGALNAMTGTAPNLVLTVGSTTVRTSSSTDVKRKGDLLPFSALRTGMSLHVVGTRQTNGSIDARKIEIEDEDEAEFRTEGSLTGLTGTCPAVRFTLAGSTIVTSTLTRFDDIACSTLASNMRVEVRGFRQSDNTVAATRVKRK